MQLSLPMDYSPAQLIELGKTLGLTLREQGVLIIGSGSMTHNLSEFFTQNSTDMSYVQRFSRWIESTITRGDTASLINYRALAPDAVRAHPTDEHLMPLLFAYGAAMGDTPKYLSREVMGNLAMDAIAF
jgi:4,5-DOPA dioxygenase extradiol